MPDVNVQHLVALLLVDRGLTFHSAHDRARMQDPAVLSVRRLIELVPSEELTAAHPPRQAIVEIAKPLGIAVHDHIIVGKEGHASLKGLKLIYTRSR